MKIQATHEYPGSPEDVIAMMRDPQWLSDVAQAAGADTHDVSVDGDRISLKASIATPERAQKLVGSHMTFVMTVHWDEPDGAGARTGTLDVTMDGFPATMVGKGRMAAVSEQTTQVQYDADFSVSVPLLGRKIEQTAEPYVRRVIDTQQQVGVQYLSAK